LLLLLRLGLRLLLFVARLLLLLVLHGIDVYPLGYVLLGIGSSCDTASGCSGCCGG